MPIEMYQLEAISDTREGKSQIVSNIDAWRDAANYIGTTLGPYGMDKMFLTNDDVLITNDGATIMKKKCFTHPAVRLLLSISEGQDAEVGDGTTSVVILAAEILNKLRRYIVDDFPISTMIQTISELKYRCVELLNDVKINLDDSMIKKIAETALSSKILNIERGHFSDIVVETVRKTNTDNTMDAIGIKKVTGGSIRDSFWVDGVAFEKCFTYAGYEQQPKKIENPSILCLNIELEFKSFKNNSEFRIENVAEFDKIVKVEWKMFTDILKKIVDSGARVVLSKLPVGDFATQYFAKYGIFSAGRVDSSDLERVAKFAGCSVVTSLNHLHTGRCKIFEEKRVGNTRYNFFSGNGSPTSSACTVILRGPGSIVLDEMERSLRDSIMATKKSIKYREVVCGGGSVEMYLSKRLRDMLPDLDNKKYFVTECAAQALEIIPFTLAFNFGLDAISVIQKLRKEHASNNIYYGVDIDDACADERDKGVYEPMEIKKNMIRSAFDAVEALLGVDSTVVSRKA